jgi:probable addiction module antidote protein
MKKFESTVSHQEWLLSQLRKSEAFQQEYLRVQLEENSDQPAILLSAMRNIAEARGYERFAIDAGLSKNALYKILNEEKNQKPRFETIRQLVHALGLRFSLVAEPRRAD